MLSGWLRRLGRPRLSGNSKVDCIPTFFKRGRNAATTIHDADPGRDQPFFGALELIDRCGVKRASTSDAAKRQLNDLFGDEPRSRIINAPKPERVTGEFKCVRHFADDIGIKGSVHGPENQTV